MSETAELQDQKPEGEQEQKINVDEISMELERLKQSNQRLLEESKTWKGKYQGIRSSVEQQETEKLQQSNDFKGLWEKSQKEIDDLKEMANSSKKAQLETSLKYEVAKNAKDADDMDILLAAIKAKKSDHLGYDRETSKWQGVDSAIEDLRKSNPGLFVSDRPGMINGRPQSAVPKEKTVEEKIAENPTAVLNDAITDLLKI